MVALRAALDHPDRVRALAVLDTDGGAEKTLIKLRYRAMGIGSQLLGLGPFLRPVTKLMFSATSHRERPELVAEWRERFAVLDIDGVLPILPAITGRSDLGPRLAEITVPTLVVVGAEDRSLPPARSEALARAIPGARLEILPGAGHLSAVEEPEAVNRVLLEFLGEI